MTERGAKDEFYKKQLERAVIMLDHCSTILVFGKGISDHRRGSDCDFGRYGRYFVY